jgi:hypothetical protein
VVAWTVVVEFVVNLYVLPFVFEAVILLIVFLSVGMQAVIENALTPSDPATRKAVEIVIGTVGTFYFVYFLVRVFTDLGGFWTKENAEDFLVGPALTLALIPLLYAFAWYSQRELANLRKQFSL